MNKLSVDCTRNIGLFLSDEETLILQCVSKSQKNALDTVFWKTIAERDGSIIPAEMTPSQFIQDRLRLAYMQSTRYKMRNFVVDGQYIKISLRSQPGEARMTPLASAAEIVHHAAYITCHAVISNLTFRALPAEADDRLIALEHAANLLLSAFPITSDHARTIIHVIGIPFRACLRCRRNS